MSDAVLPRPQVATLPWTVLLVGSVVSVGGAGALLVSERIHLGHTMHEVALFGHLACLVLGFGAVLSVDWVGLLWVVRRRTLSDVLDTAGHLTAPIWLGLAGLVLTGILLEPALDNPLTQVKLGLVLLIVWNGLFAGLLHHRLCVGASFDTAPRRVLLAAAAATTVSQVGWWGSMVIGFINH